MPGMGAQMRRPLDESMLLRLVMVSGLVSGTELAKFYGKGGGGLEGTQSLEEFLLARGLDAGQLAAVKRAYAETSDFGSTLLERYRHRLSDPAKLRGVRRALNACETAQLMAIKAGRRPKPIGEMMVELKHITSGELDEIVTQQGMLRKIEHYAEQARIRPRLSQRLGLEGAGQRLFTRSKLTLAVCLGVLALVVVFGLWLRGHFSSPPPETAIIFKGVSGHFEAPRNLDRHIININAHYANLIEALRTRDRDAFMLYKRYLDAYFTKISSTKADMEDPGVERTRGLYKRLDFAKLKDLSDGELAEMRTGQLEAKLSQ